MIKYIILLISFLSFSFSGIYLSYDLSANLEVEFSGVSADEDYDSGALTIGYEEALNENLSFGSSFDIVNMEGDGSDDGDGFFNVYGKYYYPINTTMKFWGSLGYNLPQGDMEDADGGLSYGLGLQMNNGVGIGYSFNNLSEDELDGTVTRISLSYSF